MEETSLTAFAKAARIAIIDDLASRMEANPPEGEAAFADALEALVVAGVRPFDIGYMLGAGTDNVNAWRKGVGTPHHIGRRMYAGHLVKIARKHADRMRGPVDAPADVPEQAPVLAVAA